MTAAAASATVASSPKKRYARVLVIAGSDSGGGAGIQADIKTCSALGCYATCAITALTVQNTLGVRAIHGVPTEILRGQMDAVLEDIGADAVKIGMLATPQMVQTVADALRRHKLRRVVLDPVMVATSGDRLIAPETVAVLVREIFPLASVVTPNLDEALLLLGRSAGSVRHAHELEAIAEQLLRLGARAMLLKGGHVPGPQVVDVLAQNPSSKDAGNRAQYLLLRAARIATHNGHGTGCTLSTAIAAHLALGLDLPAAVRQAREYMLGAIAAGADVHTGAGAGPLNHGWCPRAQVVRDDEI